MEKLYKTILLSISEEEKKNSGSNRNAIDQAYHMISFLRKLLTDLKAEISLHGFLSSEKEIQFFKNVKPEILGKLMYYNKIARLESISPCNIDLQEDFYLEQIKILHKEYRKYIGESDFYKYYRSARNDRDEYYYRLGNINIFDGLNSFFFDVDTDFSTYYDHKVARIVSFDLLHLYLHNRVNQKEEISKISSEIIEKSEFCWTDSKNALIELIYALHISGSISNGRVGLRKMSKLFEDMFEIRLGDIHHAFHQMKFRAGEKASYLLFLKNSLEQYMNRDM